jgi:uracil-DNA glycosylase family 4
VNSRRERYLEEMGLGPVWRLRARPDRGSRIEDSEEGSAQANAPTAAGNPAAPPRKPHIAYPVPGLAGTAHLDLADDRAARILRMEWPELKAAVTGCQACALHKTRTKTVFGVGDEQADWMLVGEAPGAEEDARGEPFVGQAGRLLDNMLAALALKRGENVYICNVLKCRPPGNRNPEPFEVEQCTPHLLRQLELIKPKLIVAMGRFAAQTLLGTDASIASLRGRLHRYRGVPLIVTYHPAYLLRSLPDKAKAWEDLCFARRTVAGL